MQVSQEAGKVAWYSHLFKNFPQFVVINTVKNFSVVSEVEVNASFFFFWDFLACMILITKTMKTKIKDKEPDWSWG